MSKTHNFISDNEISILILLLMNLIVKNERQAKCPLILEQIKHDMLADYPRKEGERKGRKPDPVTRTMRYCAAAKLRNTVPGTHLGVPSRGA